METNVWTITLTLAIGLVSAVPAQGQVGGGTVTDVRPSLMPSGLHPSIFGHTPRKTRRKRAKMIIGSTIVGASTATTIGMGLGLGFLGGSRKAVLATVGGGLGGVGVGLVILLISPERIRERRENKERVDAPIATRDAEAQPERIIRRWPRAKAPPMTPAFVRF